MFEHHSEALISPADASGSPIPIMLVAERDLEQALAKLSPLARGIADANQFTGKRGQIALTSNSEGRMEHVLFGLGKPSDASPSALRALPAKLAPGDYVLSDSGQEHLPGAVAFALGAYKFDRYKKDRGKSGARLVVADDAVRAEARRTAAACALVCDMVNTPASDMGPLQIETIAREIAKVCGAKITVVAGDDLLTQNYPAVHAVGRAAGPGREPRMIEIEWRSKSADEGSPLIALVGKGVAFDTGGLDIKPSSGMRWMKKDMGGAAHALALARLVMEEDLKVRLVVLVPAVENAISADAMRPGDVLGSRAGLSIEVGNTDAEGRLILADALARAGELDPAMTIDLATLTGAARVALGPEVVPFYTADDQFAQEAMTAAVDVGDALWRMPLWDGYESSLDSDVADVKNDPDAWAQAGSVTAALFLRRFAPTTGVWAHLDIFAWNSRSRPGWPMGAEAQAIRALFKVLRARYS